MSYIDSEDRDAIKSRVRNDRNRKLTKDRRNRNGRRDLAATDGLKPIHKNGNSRVILDDDELGTLDLSRIRSFRDLEA